jgi:hypothetical protein
MSTNFYHLTRLSKINLHASAFSAWRLIDVLWLYVLPLLGGYFSARPQGKKRPA